MFLYLSLLLIPTVGALVERSRPIGQKHIRLDHRLYLLLISVAAGFRFEVGADWFNYLHIFERAEAAPFGYALAINDPLYMFLNIIAHALGFEVWFVNFVCASIFAYGVVAFACRQPRPWLALSVSAPYLIIVIGMGYTRQAVAIGICLFAFTAISELKFKKFFVLVVLAALFHKSAIVMLPLAGFVTTQNRFLLIMLSVVSVGLLAFVLVLEHLDTLLVTYVQNQLRSGGAFVRITLTALPAAFFLLNRRAFALPPPQERVWRALCYASLLVFAILLMTDSTTIVDRLNLYLIPIQVFVLSRIPNSFGSRWSINKPMLAGTVLLNILIFAVWMLAGTWASSWLPYKFFPLWTI